MIPTPPCLVCKTPLTSVDPDKNHPERAVSFSTTGQYGSTAFDPMDGTSIEINVCDTCVEQAKAEGLILHYAPARTIQDPPVVWADPD